MNYQLHHGDCFEYMRSMPDKSVDIVITDPPYRFESKGGGFYSDNCSTKRNYLDSLMKSNCCDFEPEVFLNAVMPKLKKFYGYFFCNKSLIEEYIKFARVNGYNFDVLVMAKENPPPIYNTHHLADLEYVVMIREKGTYFSGDQDFSNYRKFYLTNCQKGKHPAEKPPGLIKRYIAVSSLPGQIVFDPFAGSGTTGVCCMEMGRNFIGCEIERKWFDLAEKQISAAACQESLFDQAALF